MADIEDALNEMDDNKSLGDNAEGKAPKKKRGGTKLDKSPLVKYGMYAGIILVQVILSYVIITQIIFPKSEKTESPAKENDSTQTQPQTPPVKQAAKPIPHPEYVEPTDSQADSMEMLSARDMDSIAGVFTLSDLVVNPAYSQGRRYFVVSIVMAFEDKKIVALAEAREAILNDRINSLLSKRSYQWFLNYQNRDILKYDIRAVVMDVLGVQNGVHIFFTKYVIQ